MVGFVLLLLLLLFPLSQFQLQFHIVLLLAIDQYNILVRQNNSLVFRWLCDKCTIIVEFLKKTFNTDCQYKQQEIPNFESEKLGNVFAHSIHNLHPSLMKMMICTH